MPEIQSRLVLVSISDFRCRRTMASSSVTLTKCSHHLKFLSPLRLLWILPGGSSPVRLAITLLNV